MFCTCTAQHNSQTERAMSFQQLLNTEATLPNNKLVPNPATVPHISDGMCKTQAATTASYDRSAQ